MRIRPGGKINSVIIVGVFPLKKNAQNFGSYYHRGAGKKSIPSMKTETGIDIDTLWFEVGVMVNKKLWEQQQ